MIPRTFSRSITATIVSQSGTKMFQHDTVLGKFFNIEFESEFGKTNLVGKVKLWNVNKMTVESLETKTTPPKITVNGGYGQNLGLILSGEVKGIEEGVSEADSWIEATITNDFMLSTLINRTWKQTPISTIVADIATMLGLVGNVTIKKDEVQKVFAANGPALKFLKSLASKAVDESNEPAIFFPEMQPGGKLYFYNKGMLTSTAPAISLNGANGLIGKPEKTGAKKMIKYWKVKSLLNHQILPGAKITVNYKAKGIPMVLSGTVLSGVHKGGSYSSEFITEVEISEP